MRLIKKTDYRTFEFAFLPKSQAEHDTIRVIYTKLETYFVNKDVKVERKIYSSNPGKCYVLMFERLDDSQLFEIAFSEYITTDGYNYG